MTEKKIDSETLNWAARELDWAFNYCREEGARLDGLRDILAAGADPDSERWLPGAKPRMLVAMNKGDTAAVAMLLTAGADLSMTYDGVSLRRVVVGNLMDAQRFPEMTYPRLLAAEAIAKLATPEGLAEYQRTCPRCQAILAASKTPAADRLREACSA